MGSTVTMAVLEMKRQELNDKIVADICKEESEGYSNMVSDTDAHKICDKLGDNKTRCLNNLLYDTDLEDKWGSDLLKSYWKAVGKGFKGTIAEYKAKKDKQAKAVKYGVASASLLAGLFSSKSNQGTDYKEVTEDKKDSKMSTGTILGISVGAIAIIGTILFFALKKD